MTEFAGHLELACAVDAQGRTFIRRQNFRAPFHISKPYWDDHALVVQVINPTAGLFAGDRLRSSVTLDTGARLRFTTPSASRVHTMTNGYAELAQEFRLATGSWLEYSPAPLIPQALCRYRQQTRIFLERDAELFFLETLAPGRVARGEIFAFAELDWEFEIRVGSELIVRERFRLEPEGESLQGLRKLFPGSYYASCFVITSRLTNQSDCWGQIRQLNSPDVLIGASRLIKAGWSIKILARDSVTLQQTTVGIRQILSSHLPALQSHVRRV